MINQCKFKINDIVFSYNGPYPDTFYTKVLDTNKFNKILVKGPDGKEEWYKEDYFTKVLYEY